MEYVYLSNEFILVISSSINIEVTTRQISTLGEGSTPKEQATRATSPGIYGNSKHVPKQLKCRFLQKHDYCGKDGKNTDH